MPQFHPDLPMPLGAGTEAETIPQSQDKPGKNRKRKYNEVGLPDSFPNPSQEIEQNQTGMENKKEFI